MKNLLNKLSRLKRYIFSPIGSTLLISLAVITVTTICSYKLKIYTSDDVIWQNALLHWRPFGGDTFYGDGAVSYILKTPLYAIIHIVFAPGRHALLAAGLILNIINFVIVYFCSLYFYRILKININRLTLMPFIWLSSFGVALTQLFLDTNMHNIEIAFILLLLTFTSKVLRGEWKFKNHFIAYITYALVAIGISLATIDDKYVLYFGVIPSLLLIATYWIKIHRFDKPITLASLVILLGVILIPVFEKLITTIGIRLTNGNVAGSGPGYLVNFNDLGQYLSNSLHSFLIIFGADFFGKSITNLLTGVGLLNALIAFTCLGISVVILKSYKKSNSSEILILASIFWLVLIIYTLSTLSNNSTQTYRYLILLPFIAPILLAYFVNKATYQKLVIFIVLASVLLNLASTLLSINNPSFVNLPPLTNQPKVISQSYNYNLIESLKQHQLTKGYANYWNANINTYLSGGDITILPVSCYKNISSPHTWLTYKSGFLNHTKTSFYIFSPTFETCSQDAVIKQFGTPQKILHLEGDTTVFIYNYDLIDNMNWSYL